MILDPPMHPVIQVSRPETSPVTGLGERLGDGLGDGLIPGRESKTLRRHRRCRPQHRAFRRPKCWQQAPPGRYSRSRDATEGKEAARHAEERNCAHAP